MWVWRRVVVSSPLSYHHVAVTVSSFPLNVTSPRICLISVSDWWTVPESWVAEDCSTPGQCSLFCYIWWPEWVNNDHTTWIMITRSEQWSHHYMNNVCCTITASKAQIVWLKGHRMCNHSNTIHSSLSYTSEVNLILIGWTLVNAVMVMLE